MDRSLFFESKLCFGNENVPCFANWVIEKVLEGDKVLLIFESIPDKKFLKSMFVALWECLGIEEVMKKITINNHVVILKLEVIGAEYLKQTTVK